MAMFPIVDNQRERRIKYSAFTYTYKYVYKYLVFTASTVHNIKYEIADVRKD